MFGTRLRVTLPQIARGNCPVNLCRLEYVFHLGVVYIGHVWFEFKYRYQLNLV